MVDNGKVKFIRKNGRVIPISGGKGHETANKKKAPGRANQKQGVTTAKRGAIAAGVGVAAGFVAYGLMRRFHLSGIPALARLQHRVKEAGGVVTMTTSAPNPQTAKFQSLLFGMKVNSRKRSGVILQHVGDTLKAAKKAHVINPNELHDAFGDKRTFAAIFRDTGGIPKTFGLDEALAKVGNDPSKLKNLFPSKKFVIKESESAMTRFSDFVKQDDISIMSDKARHTLKQAKGAIIQEQLNLTGEYRAHYLNGKIYGISHRYLPEGRFKAAWNKTTKALGAGAGGGAFVPVMNPLKRRQIRRFLADQMSQVGGSELGGKGGSLHAAFDIGDTKQGLKLIEANPSMGTFVNPIINQQFQRYSTGRWSKGVSKLGASGATVTAGTASYAIISEDNKRRRRR